MTDDDTRAAEAGGRDRPVRRRPRSRRRAAARACRSACTPRASARASTSTAPSATRRSGPATSAPSSAATTRSCRARSTPRASCATTRCTSASTRTRSCSSGAASGATPKEAPPAIVVPRPIATPRKGLTFSPGLVVAALLTVVVVAFGVYLGVQVLRFAKPPTIAVTQPGDRGRRRRRGDDRPTPSRARRCRARRSRSLTPGRGAVPGHRRRRTARGRTTSTCAAAATSSTSARSTPRPASGPRRPSRCSSPCRSSQIEAPTLTVDQPAEGASFENGAIPVAGKTTNASTVVVSAAYLGPSGPGARQGRRDAARHPPTPAPVTRRGRRRRVVQHAVRADRRALGDHRHGVQRGGQDDGADPERHGHRTRA